MFDFSVPPVTIVSLLNPLYDTRRLTPNFRTGGSTNLPSQAFPKSITAYTRIPGYIL